MIGKIKALTLALVAVCAVGAMSATAASAAQFHIAAMGKATGDGTQIAGSPATFSIPEGPLQCHNAILNIHKVMNSSEVEQETTASTATIKVEEPLTPSHPTDPETLTCTFAGLQGTVVHMNGCDFLFHTEREGATQATVKCPAGQQITITVIVTGVLKCTVHIPEQADLKAFDIVNNANDITLTNTVQKIAYQTTAGSGLGACTTTTNGTDGQFQGQVTVQGTAAGVSSKLQYS